MGAECQKYHKYQCSGLKRERKKKQPLLSTCEARCCCCGCDVCLCVNVYLCVFHSGWLDSIFAAASKWCGHQKPSINPGIKHASVTLIIRRVTGGRPGGQEPGGNPFSDTCTHRLSPSGWRPWVYGFEIFVRTFCVCPDGFDYLLPCPTN